MRSVGIFRQSHRYGLLVSRVSSTPKTFNVVTDPARRRSCCDASEIALKSIMKRASNAQLATTVIDALAKYNAASNAHCGQN